MPKYTVKIVPRTLRLAERFTIAVETWDVAHNVFVAVTFDGVTGVGESSPGSRWGESVDSVVADLETVDLDAALASPFDLEAVERLLPPGAARAALDIALHDLAARLAGVSLAELVGLGGRRLPPTSVTVPIAAVDAMVARARSLAELPALKLKVGFDGDAEVVARVREVYGGAIRIDANEGWDAETAIERLRALAPLGIELCEQPVPKGDLDGLRTVTASSPIPVYADEDAGDAGDVAALHGRVSGVNLKLRKSGGIRALIKAAAVARAHGMGVMIGCDLESGIAATAGASIASLCDVADLDGPLLLADDPFPGVTYDRGLMTLPAGPGLGIEGVPA
jgi:L-Ala-D/L-Glu epimerase